MNTSAQDPLTIRLTLSRTGYTPLPLNGKIPPLKAWQKIENVTREQLQTWARDWPSAINTGIKTRDTPTFDIDIVNETAACAVEALVREHYEKRGRLLMRIGQPPKRAFPFRTDAPFAKLVINFEARNGGKAEKLEFLCNGQQVAAFGIHPDTHKPFAWYGGEPGEVPRDELPPIIEPEARELIERCAALLVEKFGYVRAADRPRGGTGGGEDWAYLIERLHGGEALHDSLRDLAAKMAVQGVPRNVVIELLRGMMKSADARRDERWHERYDDIPRLVDSAIELFGPKDPLIEFAEMIAEARAGKPQQPEREWPTLAPEALYGLPGEVVALYERHTESDPVALLILFLVYFGNALGRGLHWRIEDTKHFTNLYNLLVGDTSEGRKGTAADRARQIMAGVDEEWSRQCVKGGLSSGEGLIWEIRDAVVKPDKKGELVVVDPGVKDKRLLVDEREFSRALTVAKREGNTLPDVIRNMWDGRDYLTSMVKNNKAVASNPHGSISGHITETELKSMLDSVSMINGYANRFLFTCVRRSKFLAFGSSPDPVAVATLQAKIRAVYLDACLLNREIQFDAKAAELWGAGGVYQKLTTGRPGMLGAICGRAAPQTRRLAVLYTVLDNCGQVKLAHLKAALALWQYCEDSARYIFGDKLGDPLTDTILSALRNSGGLSRTQIRDLFHRNQSGEKIDAALAALKAHGLARCEMRPSGEHGRNVEFWIPTRRGN